mgnify:CR=1 FL=1
MYPDHQICISILKKHLPEGYDDLSFLCKFYCIRQKVDDDLADTQLISNHIIYCHIFKIYFVIDSPALQVLCKHIIQFIPQTSEAECFFFQFYLTGFDTGHIQDIIDQG